MATQKRSRLPVLILIAVQFAVPAWMLTARWVQEGSRPTSERPASWQMYSFVPPAQYRAADGRLLSTEDLPLLVRAIDTGEVVPELLCARHQHLRSVQRLGGPDPGTFSC